MQDFVNAADCYEGLSMMHPEIEDYKLYYAQALYKACLYQEAMKVACQIDNPEYQSQVFYAFLSMKIYFLGVHAFICLLFSSIILLKSAFKKKKN